MPYEIKNNRMHRNGRAVSWKETPNKGGSFTPEGIVLHDTAGSLDRLSSVSWLANPAAKASAHFVVERDGSVTQLADLDQRCWHCGRSRLGGRPNVNEFAFGIEIVNMGKMDRTAENVFKPWFKKSFHQGEGGLEFVYRETREHGPGFWHDYTPEQIESVLELCRALRTHYSLKWITTHWTVSPGRKFDTNPLFPLDELRAAVMSADPADEPEPTVTASVNHRRWPSYQDNVIQVIPRAAAVDVLRSGRFKNDAGIEELWHLVSYKEHEGWVQGDYLDMA